MVHNRCSTPIADFDSSTESDTDKSCSVKSFGPENQLGLESQYEFDLPCNNQVDGDIALEKEGKIKYHEGAIKY